MTPERIAELQAIYPDGWRLWKRDYPLIGDDEIGELLAAMAERDALRADLARKEAALRAIAAVKFVGSVPDSCASVVLCLDHVRVLADAALSAPAAEGLK